MDIVKVLVELLPVILPILLDCFDDDTKRREIVLRSLRNPDTAEAALKWACSICIEDCCEHGKDCPHGIKETYENLGGKTKEENGVVSIVI